MPYNNNAVYLDAVWGSRERLIDNARSALADVDYDTIIGTGLSGSLIIPVLAEALDKQFAIVRKQNDGSHSSMTVEGRIGDKWIMVDDQISTGRTFVRVYEGVKDVDGDTKFVGAYLYFDGECFYQPQTIYRHWLSWLPERALFEREFDIKPVKRWSASYDFASI